MPQSEPALAAMPGPLVGVSPLEVATVPARSSLEETSLGELLPGSILSDSLETKIFTRSEGLWCIRGGLITGVLGVGRQDCC